MGIHGRIIVKGNVQGVGFRFSTQITASEFNIAGWVKNLDDGSVEIQAEGEESNMRSFVREIEKGVSPYSTIESVNVEWSNAIKGYHSFSIIHQ